MELSSLQIAQGYLDKYLKTIPAKERQKISKISADMQLIFDQYNLDQATRIAGLLFFINQEKILSAIEKSLEKEVTAILKNLKLFYQNIVKETEDQATQIKQLFLVSCLDIRIMFVCITYNLAALENLDFFEEEEQHHLSQQALNVFAPISSRFGFVKIKRTLERISFSFLYPNEYDEMQQVLNRNKEKLKLFYKEFISKVKTIFKEEAMEYSFSLRTKEAWSAFLKAQKKDIEFDQLYDLIACRIIVKSKMDCYKALGIIHGEYKPLRDRFKDYIINPKPNGYQSIHTSISSKQGYHFEVQIRTERMHEVAEMGLAAHFSYKEQKQLSPKELKNIQWIKDLAGQLQNMNDTEHVIELFKSEMAYDQIYVFSPKGEVIKLPKGATILDFAFAIHTDIGLHCAGGLINNVLLPMKTKVTNGDKIKILTNTNSQPKSSWLLFAVTNKARYKIRSFLSAQSEQEVLDLGEHIYEKKLKKYRSKKIDFNKESLQNKLLKKYNLDSLNALYKAIGYGKIELDDDFITTKPNTDKNKKKLEHKSPQSSSLNKEGIVSEIDIDDDIRTRLAQCCKPTKKDSIVGLVAKSGMISVHKAQCSKIFYFIDKNKIIALNWQNSLPIQKPSQLEFEFPNNIKTYYAINLALNKDEVDIYSVNYSTENHIASLVANVRFRNEEDKNEILKSILENKNVKCRINNRTFKI